jgi:hypothetical protein
MDKKKIDEFILAADSLSEAAKFMSLVSVVGTRSQLQEALERMVDAGEAYDEARDALDQKEALNEYRN